MKWMDVEEKDGIEFYRWKIFKPYKHKMSAILTTRAVDFRKPFKESWLAQALGAAEVPLVMANQVHGTRIAAVSKIPERSVQTFPGEYDALHLQTPGVIGLVRLADCLPVIVYDPLREDGIVCHAGWRGTAAGMAELAVKAMLERGSRVDNLAAAAGPGIGPCCYTVKTDVFRQFQPWERVELKSERNLHSLDLEEINLIQLRRAGINPENIGRGGFCTACRLKEFYSYRKEGGKAGRYGAALLLHQRNGC